MRDVVEGLLQVLAGRHRGALATVVRTSGSTPQKAGARMLLRPDGTTVGTVGGGAIERVVVEALEDTKLTGQSQMVARDLGFDLGMCCGGRMEVFVEAIEAPPRLILFGAGHVARPTAALARTVGFGVCVVDGRDDWATAERFPGCTLEVEEPAAFLRRTTLADRDWLVIVTHDHAMDEETLRLALTQSPRYIGLVGSRRKTFRILQRIAARTAGGAGPASLAPLDRVFAPVGLDIGAVTPEELAVSIVGELVALRHGKAAVHLRAVGDPRLERTLASAGGTDDDTADETPSEDAESP